MSFGLRVWDENSNLSMDTSTFTYQVIWQGVIDFSGSTLIYTFNIPDFNPANCVFMVIPTRPEDVQTAEGEGNLNRKSYPYVTTAVGQVVARAFNPLSTTGATTSRIIARAYAIRYGA